MSRSLLVAACLISVTTLAACGEDEPSAETGEADAPLGPTWHADVAPILDAHCNRCHTGGDAVAPYQFDTYDAAVELMPLWWSSVESGRMPPWQATAHSAPMMGDFSLPADRRATLEAWIDGGMPEGDAEQPGAAIEIPSTAFERADVHIEMPVAYDGEPDLVDEYRCFVVDWPVDAPTFITGAEVEPGNRAAVHHVILYAIPPGSAAAFEAFDAADPAPGYPCFGNPLPTGVARSPALRFTPVMGWVPGLAGRTLDGDTGFAMEPGSRIVMQMHYFGLGAHPEPDRTRASITLEPTVERPVCNMPLVDPNWVLVPNGMRIPADAAGVHHRYADTAGRTMGQFACERLDFEQPLLVHSVIPHMHTLGQRIMVSVERADGTTETVVDIPRWDFGWQFDYVLADPIYVAPDDRLAVDCWFDNTAAARAEAGWASTVTSDVFWGDGTGDEMCLAFVLSSNL